MSLSIKEDRRYRLLLQLDNYICERSLRRSDADSLVGKLIFCVMSQFGRVGRAAISQVGQHARHSPSPAISRETEFALAFLYDLIRDLPPFTVSMYPPKQESVLVWTDAMFEKGGRRLDGPERGCTAAIGAIVWCPRQRRYFHASKQIEPAILEWLFSIKEQYIAQLGMLAAMCVYEALPQVFTDALVIHFIDNQGVLWNAAHGSSTEPGCAMMTHTTSLLQARLRARVWYEYVPSALNISDDPSRGDFAYLVMACAHGLYSPWSHFEITIPKTLGLW